MRPHFAIIALGVASVAAQSRTTLLGLSRRLESDSDVCGYINSPLEIVEDGELIYIGGLLGMCAFSAQRMRILTLSRPSVRGLRVPLDYLHRFDHESNRTAGKCCLAAMPRSMCSRSGLQAVQHTSAAAVTGFVTSIVRPRFDNPPTRTNCSLGHTRARSSVPSARSARTPPAPSQAR